jgi:D-arabinose 1-dehydrogenase-like Zn-dependent alcohol dehydrogenase
LVGKKESSGREKDSSLKFNWRDDKETQEMIDFGAEHNVKPDTEVVPIDL